jgi:hypothetical protein
MTHFTAVCRTALILAVLAVLTLAGSLPVALAEQFRASGSYQITRVRGDTKEGIVSGRAAPGGNFDGSFVQRFRGRNGRQVGTATLEFGRGTLTLAYDIELDDDIGLFVGTWMIIVGGTGAYEGATGGGVVLSKPPDETGAGDIALEGTLNR